MVISTNLSTGWGRWVLAALMGPAVMLAATPTQAQSPANGNACPPTATLVAQADAAPKVVRTSDARPASKAAAKMMASNDMMGPDSRFVYTLDNDVERNGIVVHRRGSDGSLMPLAGSPFQTAGKGLSGGDIDEQGAIRVHGSHVLAVNPGSDSIAVLQKTPRGLLHVEGSPFPSMGSTPLSLAVHGDLVYVANQAAEFAHPKSAPNITGFRIAADGRLMPLPESTVMLPKGMGPAQVEFAANGRILLATAGFQTEGGKGSRIYAWRVGQDGRLTMGSGSPIQPEGATGTVGFSVNPAGTRAFVSTFNSSGVVMFHIDPETAAIRQAGSPVPNDQRAACWTAISRDGMTLYVGNFVSNSVSVFDIADDGSLTLLGSIPRRGATNKDTKDIELSRDGKFLYAIGSGARQISVFRIEANRLLTELPAGQSPVRLTTGQNTTGLAAE